MCRMTNDETVGGCKDFGDQPYHLTNKSSAVDIGDGVITFRRIVCSRNRKVRQSWARRCECVEYYLRCLGIGQNRKEVLFMTHLNLD